ncbi:MAG: hypothetical protein WBC85_00770, partial [Planktotalea sp.]|uniref:hypothetical protein n=1 Tax=Planktotalea sp. TaxID=2029877 RepID=UPI003C78B3EE
MRNIFKTLSICPLLLAPALSAQERVLDPAKAAGFDTIITQCVSFTRVDFVNALCDDLLLRIAPMIDAVGLNHIPLGRTEWGYGSDVYLTPGTGSQLGTPVNLTIYLRGTDEPGTAALWLSLYETVNAPRKGRLAIWEDYAMGVG